MQDLPVHLGKTWASPSLSGTTVEVGEALPTALGEEDAASFRSLCLYVAWHLAACTQAAWSSYDSGLEYETFLSLPVAQG